MLFPLHWFQEPLIGVVFDPVTQNLYYAVKGQGAFKNHKSWQPDLQLEGKSTFTLHMDRTFPKYEHYDEFITSLEDQLQELSINELQLQKLAGGVLNAIWSLDQAPGCYFKLPKPTPGGGSLWDFAATACIFNELGAPASSFDGTALDLNRGDSTFMNHRGVLYASNPIIANIIRELPLW
jgi:fructose-1,6-bisphosphatase/inositol monophosphatase family enzyme